MHSSIRNIDEVLSLSSDHAVAALDWGTYYHLFVEEKSNISSLIECQCCCKLLMVMFYLTSSSDTMKMWPSYHLRQVPENRHIIIIKRPSIVHRFVPMPFPISMTKIHRNDMECLVNRIAICHVKCSWNKIVTVRGRCCSNRKVLAVYRDKIAMHPVNCFWNKKVMVHVIYCPNKTLKSPILTHARAI